MDGLGNSYVTGYFSFFTATFGHKEGNETHLTNAGFTDIFVAKYDSMGALVWAKRAGGVKFDEGRGIAVDGSGNSYVVGEFEGRVTFGLGEANRTSLTSAGSVDLFVAKYGADAATLTCTTAVVTTGCRVNGKTNQLCRGTPDNDTIVGTAGNDVILGLGGDDVLRGQSGDDLLCGGDGNDLLLGAGGADNLFGEGGDDRLIGNDGIDFLDGGAGADKMDGGAGADVCTRDVEDVGMLRCELLQ